MYPSDQDLQELSGFTSAALFRTEELLELLFSNQDDFYIFWQAAA